jgi:outer membrane lipase/esterase
VASNYAVGGATAGDIGRSQFPLGTQVQLFLSDVRGSAPSDAVYVIALGGNDIRAALAAQDPAAVIHAAMSSIAQNVDLLYRAGATKFLIWSAPDLGITPAIRRLDKAVCPVAGCVAGGARAATAAYNAALHTLVQGLAGLPGVTIVAFDTVASLNAVQADPRRFGLLNAKDACIEPFVRPLFRCAQPDRYFFWDGIHPTRAGHAIIAYLVAKAVVEAVQDR